MKRTTDTHQPPINRRSLLRNHHPELLQDPAVVAFLNGDKPEPTNYRLLERSFVLADEPALLLNLLVATDESALWLCGAADAGDDAPPLPDGMFEFFAEHINQAPSVTSFTVTETVLTTQACAKLQASLGAPGCKLTTLLFVNCTFADAHVQFIAAAPTLKAFTWSNEYDHPPAARKMDRVLPALAHWPLLEHVALRSMGAPLDLTAICQMLLANPTISVMHLFCDTAPAALGVPGNPTPDNPFTLFENLRQNRTGLTQLHFQIATPGNVAFTTFCMARIVACLQSNTTLQALAVPGIMLCTPLLRQQFEARIQNNRSLISLGPVAAFGQRIPPSIVANAKRHIWFSQDFINGAVLELMRLIGAPSEVGTVVAPYLYATPYERTYCAAIVGLLCKSTNTEGAKLRSAGLKVAITNLMRANDAPGCLALIGSLSAPGLGLQPQDKAEVVDLATRTGRLAYLPAGYAT